MLALRNPQEAYRRVDFDARIEGASAAQLVAHRAADAVDLHVLAAMARHGDSAAAALTGRTSFERPPG